MTRIALVGKSGLGKTSAANFLVLDGFIKLSIAGKLKEICKDLWPEQFLNGNKPRELLQTVGTDVIRAYDPDVWVNYVVRQLVEEKDYVVDDCRFLNEAQILRDNGFVIVRIDGPQRTPMVGQTSQHASETEMDNIAYDYILPNNGTLDELDLNLHELKKKIEEDN